MKSTYAQVYGFIYSKDELTGDIRVLIKPNPTPSEKSSCIPLVIKRGDVPNYLIWEES